MKKKYFSLSLVIVFLTTSDIKSEYKYESLQTHIHTLDNGAKVHLSTNIDKPHTQTKEPLIVTDDNYKKLLSGSKPVILEFWAEWCGTCYSLVSPVIDELAAKYEGRVVIGKVDFDINEEIVSEFGVRTIPTVLFFKGGEVVDIQKGAAEKYVYVEKINKLLKK